MIKKEPKLFDPPLKGGLFISGEKQLNAISAKMHCF